MEGCFGLKDNEIIEDFNNQEELVNSDMISNEEIMNSDMISNEEFMNLDMMMANQEGVIQGYIANEYDYNQQQFEQTENVYLENLSESYNIEDEIIFDNLHVVENEKYVEEEKFFEFKDLISFGICIMSALIMAYLLTAYVAQHTRVSGNSMNYNLSDGDILFIDKLAYEFGEPSRFDIVVFSVATQDETFFIKRVIGLPNETVRIDDDGKIYINGSLLEEDYGYEKIKDKGQNYNVKLGKDEYFVMGDNRNGSTDSRSLYVGNVRKEDIIGKVTFRFWKLNEFGQIDNFKNSKIREENDRSSTNEH